MGYEYAKPGIGNVGSYQISGVPFVTSSLVVPNTASAPLEIIFPSVTQRIIIQNDDSTSQLRVGFSANGVSVGKKYFLLDEHAANKHLTPAEFRVRTDRIFLLSNGSSSLNGTVSISAELTGIKPEFNLAASYSGSEGIG